MGARACDMFTAGRRWPEVSARGDTTCSLNTMRVLNLRHQKQFLTIRDHRCTKKLMCFIVKSPPTSNPDDEIGFFLVSLYWEKTGWPFIGK